MLTEADPVLRAERLESLVDSPATGEEVVGSREKFDALSSGHKIAILTLTSLVRYTEERTLILIDEPETHLHPPLLSALVRALSKLAVERNGVAVLATHSPVVLQDIPRTCVVVVRRNGDLISYSQPRIETFGESVSVLTSAAFGLDVAETGFYEALQENIDDIDLNDINAQLGAEGRALLRAMLDGDDDDVAID